MRRDGKAASGGRATGLAADARGLAKPMGAPLPAGVQADARIGNVPRRVAPIPAGLSEPRPRPARVIGFRLEGDFGKAIAARARTCRPKDGLY